MAIKRIRVLIVDDSLLFREKLASGISTDPEILVVAKAVDPFDARDKILEHNPDVMICDVEMPKMNGVEFIRRLLPQYPLPVIVVSAINDAVFDAMNVGAVDFVSKPDALNPKSVENFFSEIIDKIKIASRAQVKRTLISEKKSTINKPFNNNCIIAMGASTGGTEALYSVLKQLPDNIPGIVIVQHIPPVFSRMFAQRLDSQIALRVKEAQSGDYVEPGTVLISPGDQHMRIRKVGDKYKVQTFESEKVNGHCPSVDVLFESVAKEAGKDAIGVILTGMGYDGARGLLAMKRKGARTIGQDRESCVVYGMPKVAFELGAVEKQVPLDNIPKVLLSMLN